MKTTYTELRGSFASGLCPYCGQHFELHHLHDICAVIECAGCKRWYAVKTHIEVSHTTHRIEGEGAELRVAA
jgi:hypothetical protein